jgi:23S rRNA U2552 (ribose-2'-O)-methylase RlmE/FtsJ
MRFLLSKGGKTNNIDNIELSTCEKNKITIFKSYNDILSDKKKEIDKEDIQKYWDKMKKIGNPYELIYTSYNKKRKNDSISSYSPISRSYFKLWEIYFNFNLFENVKENINFVHLAEGPGGFMESSINYCKLKNFKNCKYWGITLKPNDEYVPDWNKLKKMFKKDNNCNIEYGDLYIYNDILDFIKKINCKCHIVTADGGFDYSNDFNGQEINSSRIIYSEIATALNILKKNGHFIIKLFDLFTLNSIQYLQLLNNCFENVTIFKPETSRPANSEKYIVCTNYLDNLSNEQKHHLLLNIDKWKMNENEQVIFKKYKISNELCYDIDKLNKIYIDFQIKSITYILNIITNKLNKNEYHNTLKDQVFNAIEWCEKYQIPINENSIYYKKNN